MSQTILKAVPGYEGLEISPDGDVVYYRGKIKKVSLFRNQGGRKYKGIHLTIDGRPKRLSVSRLVFAAYIGPFPRGRKVHFIDGNHLNTNFKNLSPKPLIFPFALQKVPGLDEVYINRNGTLIVQYGYMVNITVMKQKQTQSYYACHLQAPGHYTYFYVHRLVMMAYSSIPAHAKVIHLDGNWRNNDYTNLRALSLREYGKRNKALLRENRKKGLIPPRPSAIPTEHTEKVKKWILTGKSLKEIAKIYHCSDMAVVRFKQRHFTKAEIKKINAAKGIVTQHTPRYKVEAVIRALKKGVPQIELSKKYGLSPTVVCRINRVHIREAHTIQ